LRGLASLAIAVVTAASAHAQTTPNAPAAAPAAAEAPADRAWSFYASTYRYLVPDDGSYWQPTFTADRDRLHLEARYNYEALDTASVWVGVNFSGGDRLAWEVTPMFAGLFGDLEGVAPGYKGSLGWWKVALYSEGEHVVDSGDSADSFSYTWSELTVMPVEWLRLGIAIQQTYAHETDSGSQGGPLVGFSYKNVDVTAYVFDLHADKKTFVIAAGVRF
jgi:hypothetical protein